MTVGATSNSITLAYDPDHARSRQTSTVGGVSTVTTYLNDAATDVMSENVKVGTAASQWKNYIVADGHAVAQRLGSGTTAVMTYFVLDHLGSVAVITDENGAVGAGGRQFYDAWGKMRNADGSPDATCQLPSASAATRGYTGQEQIAAVCLDNYNARLYDPQIGRFLTADPSDGSGLNRYWYVGDNPLSLTDPTGLCFLGCFWKSPTGKVVIDIVLVIVLHEYALPLIEEQLAVTVADVANIAASAGIAGYVTTGRLDSALIQSAEAVAMYGVGQYVDGLEDPAHPVVTNFQGGIIRVGLHGLVGGLGSAAGRGGFVSGFLAGGFSAAADSVEMPGRDPVAFVVNTVEHALAGGTGSVLGGGKFANGATTGAFGYLFNQLYEEKDPREDALPEADDEPLDNSPEAAAEACPNCEAPQLEPPKGIPPWEGNTESYVLSRPMVVYRIWGGASGKYGAWFATFDPLTREEARNDYALPPINTAENVTRVEIPAGVRIQIGAARGIPGWGGGGGTQVHILEFIPFSSYGVTTPLQNFYLPRTGE